MEFTRKSQPSADGEHATLFVAFELSKAKWLVALHAPDRDKVSVHMIDGDDTDSLLAEPDRPRNVLLTANGSFFVHLDRLTPRKLAKAKPTLWVKGGGRVSWPACPLNHQIAADLLRRSETSVWANFGSLTEGQAVRRARSPFASQHSNN